MDGEEDGDEEIERGVEVEDAVVAAVDDAVAREGRVGDVLEEDGLGHGRGIAALKVHGCSARDHWEHYHFCYHFGNLL